MCVSAALRPLPGQEQAEGLELPWFPAGFGQVPPMGWREGVEQEPACSQSHCLARWLHCCRNSAIGRPCANIVPSCAQAVSARARRVGDHPWPDAEAAPGRPWAWSSFCHRPQLGFIPTGTADRLYSHRQPKSCAPLLASAVIEETKSCWKSVF